VHFTDSLKAAGLEIARLSPGLFRELFTTLYIGHAAATKKVILALFGYAAANGELDELGHLPLLWHGNSPGGGPG
jgi:hypothetical protein